MKHVLDYRNTDWTKFKENRKCDLRYYPQTAEDIDMYDQLILQHLQTAISISIPSRIIKTYRLKQHTPYQTM
jgi:hypothetical protein